MQCQAYAGSTRSTNTRVGAAVTWPGKGWVQEKGWIQGFEKINLFGLHVHHVKLVCKQSKASKACSIHES